MKIVKIDDKKAVEMSDPLFTGGKVHLQSLVGKDDTDQVGAAMVNFSAGARCKLHTHDYPQVLYVTRGKGVVATEKERHEVTPGTLIFIPAKEPHWHGATGKEAFSHLSVIRPGVMQIVE
ncbi:MAG TPA: cupin domain-containing protein [Dehalococcoidales bacterium]|nr:MAG: hypothetical protein A2Z05_02355 [Chloroflexi bacterium RBG_16_60_22]HJX12407.1 cupin domain-containing protein [Dehalococcoidales bacterium]